MIKYKWSQSMTWVFYELKMTAISFKPFYVYKENIFYFLYRKRRLDTKSEDAIGLEPMETPMSERKTNVYFDDSDGTALVCFKDLINHYQFKKKYKSIILYLRMY